ncbi:MAG: [Lachnospiraceae bacterium]|nr:[FeFe] hydrogenase, group A [Lachnospiraceae bacterium]
MVNIKINGKDISVAEGTTILEAAGQADIHIPHLCYLKGINEISACKVCVVEIEGQEKLVASCTTKVEEGQVILTDSPRVREVRRTNVQLILSEHDYRCATCIRSGNCSLQDMAHRLGISEIPYKARIKELPWNKDFPLIRDASKCIKCMRCVQICEKVQSLNIWDIQNTGAHTTVNTTGNTPIELSDCSLCAQCITHCPVGALHERGDLKKVYQALADPEKVTVVQIAPAVRAAWMEDMHIPENVDREGCFVAALKKLGFDYVLDTVFAADLTIMEEGNELLKRLPDIKEKKLPMFTSCCPGWVSFVKTQYPQLTSRLSTAKSPQQMQGAVIKTYFAEKIGKDPKDIISISVMPCVSKKREITLPDMGRDGYDDVDIVITTRELVRLVNAGEIDAAALDPMPFDSPVGSGTGAGVIFGATGGVMEAALRTAYAVVMGEEAPLDAFTAVRAKSDDYPDASANCGIVGDQFFGKRAEAEFKLKDTTVRTCTVSGLGTARELIEDILAGRAEYDFVEVMACPGGCVAGGGQPIHDGEERGLERSRILYKLDDERKIRRSHENPEIKTIYEEFFKNPLSEKSEELLHTKHGL